MLMIGSVSATALALSAAAFAQQGGTAQEARAMLDKAVAAVKADQAVALAMFIKRGRVSGPRALSILFQNRGREDPGQSEGCSSRHGR
jgi:hypothetical protein